jgi:hypothetical protein
MNYSNLSTDLDEFFPLSCDQGFICGYDDEFGYPSDYLEDIRSEDTISESLLKDSPNYSYRIGSGFGLGYLRYLTGNGVGYENGDGFENENGDGFENKYGKDQNSKWERWDGGERWKGDDSLAQITMILALERFLSIERLLFRETPQ